MPAALLASLALMAGLGGQTPGWKKVILSPSITVSLPVTATPVGVERPKDTPGQILWTYESPTCRYLITIIPIPAKDLAQLPPDGQLAQGIASLCDALGHGKVKNQRDTTFFGWPGLDNLVVGDSVAMRCKTYLVDRTLYQLAAAYPPDAGRPASLDTFLDSLAITPKPSAGPLKEPGPVFSPYSPTGARFTVGMPGKPETEDVQFGPAGHEQTMHRCVGHYGNRQYVVAYCDVPAGTAPEGLRDFTVQDTLNSLKAKPVKPKRTEKRKGQYYDTVEFTSPDGLGGRLDVMISDGRCFNVLMIYPAGHAGSKDIETFFGSFKVTSPESNAR